MGAEAGDLAGVNSHNSGSTSHRSRVPDSPHTRRLPHARSSTSVGPAGCLEAGPHRILLKTVQLAPTARSRRSVRPEQVPLWPALRRGAVSPRLWLPTLSACSWRPPFVAAERIPTATASVVRVEKVRARGLIPRRLPAETVQQPPAIGIAWGDLAGIGVEVAGVTEVVVGDPVRVAAPMGLDVGAVAAGVAVDVRAYRTQSEHPISGVSTHSVETTGTWS